MASLSSQQFGDYTLHYSTEDHGERKPRHVIEAHHPDAGRVGRLSWYGTTHRVDRIAVDPEHGRRGLASAMWSMSQKARPRSQHSPDRTAMGDSWAQKVGGTLPRKKRY